MDNEFTGKLVLSENLIKIGGYSFGKCKFAGNLIIPNRIMEVSNHPFYICAFNGILSLPDGLETIGENFLHANSLDFEDP